MKKVCISIVCMMIVFISIQAIIGVSAEAFHITKSNVSNMRIEDEIAIRSSNALMISLDEDRILYDKNSEDKVYPASITKVMSALVALDMIQNMDEKVVFTKEMLDGLFEAEASVAGFVLGEEVSMKDLLYGLLLPSGADAGRALSITLSGSEEAFVKKMNQKAKELGMDQTHFVNTSGLHDDDHYTTCADLVKLIKEAMKNKVLYEMFCSDTYQVAPTNQHPEGLTFHSSMRLQLNTLGGSSYILGGKTGYTQEAGSCLASVASYEGMNFLLVTTGGQKNGLNTDSAQDAITLYSHFIDKYDQRLIYRKGEELTKVKVKWNYDVKELTFKAQDDIYVMVPKEIESKNIVKEYIGEKDVETPIEKNQVLGSIEIKVNGESVKNIQISNKDFVEKNILLYAWDVCISFMSQYRNIFIIIGFGIIALIVSIIWRKKSKRYV